MQFSIMVQLFSFVIMKSKFECHFGVIVSVTRVFGVCDVYEIVGSSSISEIVIYLAAVSCLARRSSWPYGSLQSSASPKTHHMLAA